MANFFTPAGRYRAFTLLEMLVSMTVLSLLLLVLLSMVDGSTKLWRQSENSVDSYREARAAVNMLASDLASIAVTTNTNLFQLDTLADDKLPATTQRPPEASHLFFLSAQPSYAQGKDRANNADPKSDLCAVGYFLARDETSSGSGEKTMNLYRYFRSSNDTFRDIIRAGGSLVPDPLLSNPDIGEELLARNITSFKVRAYKEKEDGTLETFNQTAQNPMPDVLEVEITALNNEVAKRVKDWTTAASSPTDDIKRNARQFTVRERLHPGIARITPTPSPTP